MLKIQLIEVISATNIFTDTYLFYAVFLQDLGGYNFFQDSFLYYLWISIPSQENSEVVTCCFLHFGIQNFPSLRLVVIQS